MVAGCPQCEKKSQTNSPNDYLIAASITSWVVFMIFLLGFLIMAGIYQKNGPISWYHHATSYLGILSFGVCLISWASAWLIGEYFYVFECPGGEIHCHKEAPVEKNKKFFFWRHIKVSATEEKNEETEITTPIMRLAHGGIFKNSEVLCPPLTCLGLNRWAVKRLRNDFVELRNIEFLNLNIGPVDYKNALFALSSYTFRQFGLWEILHSDESQYQEVKRLSSDISRMTGFGLDICKLVLDLKESKEKMRSPVGQKAREALEAALAKLPEREVETWMAVAAKERAEAKAKNDKPAAIAAA